MSAFVLGSAELRIPRLPSPTASSADGLSVAKWAHKPARLARMDRLCAVALCAADAALVAAGRSPAQPDWRAERSGIVLGTAFGCHSINETYYRGYLAGGVERASPRDFAYTLPSSPVGEITIHHQILGPASTTVGGLSAGVDALAEGLRHLEADRADLMLVVAADVSTPLLDRMGAPAIHDSAAAMLLGKHASGPRLVATASRFVPDDPAAAVRAALARLGEATAVFAPAHLHEALRDLRSLRALPDDTLGATPLFGLRVAMAEALPSAIVVAADPTGQAAAVRLELGPETL